MHQSSNPTVFYSSLLSRDNSFRRSRRRWCLIPGRPLPPAGTRNEKQGRSVPTPLAPAPQRATPHPCRIPDRIDWVWEVGPWGEVLEDGLVGPLELLSVFFMRIQGKPRIPLIWLIARRISHNRDGITVKKVILIVIFLCFPSTNILGQETETKESKYLLGFSLVLPTSTWPATALSPAGTSSFLEGQDHSVTSYGFGIVIQREVAENVSIFFDINTYNYNIFLAEEGSDAQSIWTAAEGATHWDEPGAPQQLNVQNLPTDVHFDMQATGFRLGGKYIFGNEKIRPWAGAAFGFYKWQASYFNEDKTQTYGDDQGYVSGLTFLVGFDFELTSDIVISAFGDFASPVANYEMEGLFYPEWDIDYDAHIMGTNRFGLTLSFIL
jgi:hypothetical protein